MKTLYEVIDALRHCVSGSCIGCPYDIFEDGCQCDKDALHYLKEYREMKEHLACLDAATLHGEDTQRVNNPALTWDELRQMEGKPVWVETKSSKRWGLNDGTYVDAFGNDCITIKVLHDLCHFEKYFIGITWNAYRKERE